MSNLIKLIGTSYVNWIEARMKKVNQVIEEDPQIQDNFLIFHKSVEAELEEFKKAALRLGTFCNESIEALAVGYVRGGSTEIAKYYKRRNQNSTDATSEHGELN